MTFGREAGYLELNPRKTVQMTFRKGGRLPATAQIKHKDTELTRVNAYKYLGVTLQTNGRSFTKHIKENSSSNHSHERNKGNMTTLHKDSNNSLPYQDITNHILCNR
jgi:hypothetical protein